MLKVLVVCVFVCSTTQAQRIDQITLTLGANNGLHIVSGVFTYPETYGAKRDGVSNDSSALQNAINNAPMGSAVVLSPGTYLTGQLLMRSDVYLFSFGSVLKMNVSSSSYQSALLKFDKVHNTGVAGILVLDGNIAEVPRGENSGHGIYILGCHDLSFDCLNINAMPSDGISIGWGTTGEDHITPQNILFRTVSIDSSYRSGVSLTSGKDIRFENLIANHSYGTAPRSGVNIENSEAVDTIRNITFGNLTVEGNVTLGFIVSAVGGRDTLRYVGSSGESLPVNYGVVIEHIQTRENGAGVAISHFSGVSILGGNICDNRWTGIDLSGGANDVTISHCNLFGNYSNAIFAYTENQYTSSNNWVFSGCRIFDNATTNQYGGAKDGIGISATNALFPINHVRITDCIIRGQRCAVWGGEVSNVTDVVVSGIFYDNMLGTGRFK